MNRREFLGGGKASSADQPPSPPGERASAEPYADLKRLATRLRIEIVKMIGSAGSGHPGGSLSEIDLLTALYFNVMRHDPKDPSWEDRDRFVLSKGHGAPALYAALAYAGYFDPSLLPTLRKLGSPLQGHPDRRMLPVLEASTGSLGQGLSIGIGMALAARLSKRDYHVFVLVGDGEIQEGQNWEAAMFAGFHKLSNLTLIVDNNRQQLDGWVKDILDPAPLAEKLRAFRWHAVQVDGHDLKQIVPALQEARSGSQGKPTCIVANTIKGKGVSFMENSIEWHGVAPKKEQVEAAIRELEARIA